MSRVKQQALFKVIVKELIKPAFKAEGFSGDGQNFRKQENGFVKVFNIQKDARDPERTDFVFNLGCYLSYEHVLKYGYDEVFDKIKESQCGRFRTRVSVPGFKWEKWFTLTEKTKFEDVKVSVFKAVEKSLKMFNQIQTVYDLIESHKQKSQFQYPAPDLEIGLTLIKLGDKKLGVKLFNKGYPEFLQHLRSVKERLKNLKKQGSSVNDDYPEKIWKKFNEIARELKIPVKDKDF
jgi:hypothetical protein